MHKRVIITLLLLTVFSIVFAVPFTTSGFMKVPDAYVLPRDMSRISFSSYLFNPNWDRGINSCTTADDKWNFYTATNITYGVMNFGEIGFVFNTLPEINDNKLVSGNINTDVSTIYSINAQLDLFKMADELNIAKVSNKFPTVSIGVENLLSEQGVDPTFSDLLLNALLYTRKDTTWSLSLPDSIDYIDTTDVYAEDVAAYDLEDYRKNSFYISLSKQLKYKTVDFDITAGYGIGRFQTFHDSKQMFKGIFFALKTSYKNFSLVVEEDGFSINAGLQYDLGNLSIKTGIYRLDEMVMANPNPRIAFSLQHKFYPASSFKTGKNWLTGQIQEFSEKRKTKREKKIIKRADEIISQAKADMDSKDYTNAVSILEKNIGDYAEYTEIQSEMNELLAEAKDGMELTSIVDKIGGVREKSPEAEEEEISSLEEELQKIREKRKKAEKDLEELKKLLGE
ncbi:MAG: hypothetical protein H8E33_01225 [Candidatus Cloacimonetes bacterium]|nr:hypothetical protein [Candidatus Cloacimonadota bacterium]